jgi:hypothetical protein
MWLDLPFAQVSRSMKHNVHTTFFFPNPLTVSEELHTVLGMFKDSAIILDSIRWSYLTKSAATAAMFTSVQVDFGRPSLSSSSTRSLSSRNQEYHLKTFDRFRASFPLAFWTNTSISVADRPALKQNFMETLCSFRHPWRIKKTDFTRQVITRTLSKINKLNSVCERMLVDST